MHPAHAVAFEWDEADEEHLADHGILPWEAEEVFFNGPVWVPNKKGRSGAWKMIGWTTGGRALAIIVTVNGPAETLWVITGWDATAGDVTRYLGKRRSQT